MSATVSFQNRGIEHFELEIRMIRVIMVVISILFIFNGLLRFLDHLSRLAAYDIIYSITVIVAGVVILLWKSGIEKISMTAQDNSMNIKWAGKIKGDVLMFKDIDCISLSKSKIEIGRDGMKRLRYRLDNLDVSQKRQVNDYFVRLSRERGLRLEKKSGK